MFIILGILIGFVLPIQTSMNATLRQNLHSPTMATLVSFVVGTLPLSILALAIDGSIGFDVAIISQNPWWIWIGGICGVIYLMSIVILFEKLGAAQAAILPILGQIVTGLFIDHFGWFNTPQTPIRFVQIIGALCVVFGVIGTTLQPEKIKITQQKPSNRSNLQYQLLGIFAGIVVAAQTAINGQLGIALSSSIKSAFISFTIGSLLTLLLLIHPANRPTHPIKLTNAPLWMWLGGFIGATYVVGMVYLAPLIGIGLTVISSLLGITLGSLCVEHFGWLRTPKQRVTVLKIAGIMIMLIGITLIQFM